MDISIIWMSQRSLRRAGQIPAMINHLKKDGVLPPITLLRDEQGVIQLRDGHHRLTAIWLSGRDRLAPHEYVLVDSDHPPARFGRLLDLIDRNSVTA